MSYGMLIGTNRAAPAGGTSCEWNCAMRTHANDADSHQSLRVTLGGVAEANQFTSHLDKV